MGLFGSKNNEKEVLFAVSKNKNTLEIKDYNSKVSEINGKKVQPKFINEDGINFIELGGKKYQYELVAKHQNQYDILINGKCYSFSVETPFSMERKKFLETQEGESKYEEIIAPMPGKIIEVFVEEGSIINEGDPLFILEAMKMQNEILCANSGTVSFVNIKKDQNVMKDELMMKIEKSN